MFRLEIDCQKDIKNPTPQDVEMVVKNFNSDNDYMILEYSEEGGGDRFVQAVAMDDEDFYIEFHRVNIESFKIKQNVGREKLIKIFMDFFNTLDVKTVDPVWEKIDLEDSDKANNNGTNIELNVKIKVLLLLLAAVILGWVIQWLVK